MKTQAVWILGVLLALAPGAAAAPVAPDSDGDGTPDAQEASSLCSGVHGVVEGPWCGGYAWPKGCPENRNLTCVVQNHSAPWGGWRDDYWVWDGVCTATHTANAASLVGRGGSNPCPDTGNHAAHRECWTTWDMHVNGYGWRLTYREWRSVTVPFVVVC